MVIYKGWTFFTFGTKLQSAMSAIKEQYVTGKGRPKEVVALDACELPGEPCCGQNHCCVQEQGNSTAKMTKN